LKTSDIQIPPGVKPIFDRLNGKYSLEFEPVTVRGRHFHFLHLQDIEPLIAGRDIFEESTDFPYWVKIWEAAIVMASFMAAMPPAEGKRVLELGAGLGVPGLVASAFGHRVMVTDYQEEILDFGRVSAAVNGCDGVLFGRVDWTKPSELGQFEVVIGSEVLFHPRFFEPLLDAFKRYLAPGGAIYLSHDVRRKSVAQFLPLCENDYDIAVKKTRLRSDGESFDVLMTRLVPKNA